MWSAPCQIRYTAAGNPLSLTFTIGPEHRVGNSNVFQVPNTGVLQGDADKCAQGASFCYIFDEVTYTGADGQPVTIHVIRGALVK